MKPELETKAISDLDPAPYNPRTTTPTALDGLRHSVERFGLVEPIVWNRRTGKVVGGHQRLKVLQQMGETETQVVVVDLEETEEKALNVGLNNPAIAGEFTADIHTLLAEINEQMPELSEMLCFGDLGDLMQVDWDGKNSVGWMSAAGVYLYRLEARDFTQTKRVVLIK